MKQDYLKYKGSIKSYLTSKGFNTSINPMFCIDPAHSNTNDPAMQLHEDGFKCHSCGVHGDIYDAAGLIEGLTDIKEQFEEVQRVLGGFELSPKKVEKKEFKPDPAATKEFEEFVRNHKGRKAGVESFLKTRGYPSEIIEKMSSKIAYWPGIDEAKKIISLETLEKAGIPIPTEEKKFSSWWYSGAVIKLELGYKLLFYKDGKCEKRNSTKAKTFPFPYSKDELSGTVILTEAELSALSMLAGGFDNVKSTGGTNGITKYNVKKLLKCEKIIFAFDGDNAGRYFSGLDESFINKKTGKEEQPETPVTKLIKANFKGEIYAVRLKDNLDADDFFQQGKISELKELFEKKELIYKPEKKETKKPPVDNDPKKPFQFLGYDEKSYYILPRNQQIPLKISRGDRSIVNWLCELASENWWFNMFNHEIELKDGELKTVFDRKSALQWFREESYKAGIFDENRIHGVGAHKDGEHIVFNTGKNILTDLDKTVEFENWAGEQFFLKSKRFFKLSKEKWSDKQGKELWKQINTFSFEKKVDKIAVTGYLVLAPFASILYRRPSIWITAKKGIGKSHFLEYLLVPAVGNDKYAFFSEGLSSEAFIRQSLKKDSVPVILDEFEAKNKQEALNNTKVLNLMRSSYGGKMIGKGSADHNPIVFNVNSMFCFGSINVRLDNDGDRTRVHICRMKPSVGKYVAPESFDGLRARTFSKLPKILKEIDICKARILQLGLSDRIGDTYAPLFVGTWNLVSDNEFMKNEDEKIIKFFERAFADIMIKEASEDEDKIIERILQQRIKIDSSNEKTIAEMLMFKIEDGSMKYEEILQRYGIKKTYRKDEDKTEVIAISLNSASLSQILVDTPFSDYKEIIQRNKFILEKSFPVRMAGQSTRAALLNWKEFKKEYIGIEEDRNLPGF